jgi:predicted nucleic acid-binding protein
MNLASTSNEFPTGDVVLDASVVINLLGCKHARIVIVGLGVTCLIEKRTLDEIQRHPVPGLSHTRELEVLIQDGLVCVHRMTMPEYLVYLGLVTGEPVNVLGDGESAAIATAVGTGNAVILDDRKARRICGGNFPSVPIASSLRLFVEAARRGKFDNQFLRDLVSAALVNSRMSIMKDERHIYASLGL